MDTCKRLVIAITILSVAVHSKPTEFKMCDSKWGSEVIRNGQGQTICQKGDLLTALAMAVAGCEAKLDGKNPDPSTLNEWLDNHNGFAADGSVILNSLASLSISQSLNTDPNASKQKLKSTNEVLIQDKAGSWYAVKSFSSSQFIVYDPRGLKSALSNDEFKQASIYFGRWCGGTTTLSLE